MSDELSECPSLYQPESAEEILTEPILRKLMLGFTAGLKNIPLALADRCKRYDLYPKPEDFWSDFCRTLRKECGLENRCLEWDKKIAEVLRGDRPEEYAGQAKQLQIPFECWAHMWDVAALICVGGRPFAVLHGGQLPPKDVAQSERMRRALEKQLPAQEDQVSRLVDLASKHPRFPLPDGDLSTAHRTFMEFAKELEDLLNKLYLERRNASEDRLLQWMAAELTAALASPDLSAWWQRVDPIVKAVGRACGLSTVTLLMGSRERRFELEIKSGQREKPQQLVTIKAGSFWQQVRHRPTAVTNQSWANSIRKALGIYDEEQCLAIPAICELAPPEPPIPGLIFAAAKEQVLLELKGFLARLGGELGAAMSRLVQIIAVETVRRESAQFCAWGAHDVKFPLHAAFGLGESISHDVVRLHLTEPDLSSKVAELNDALREAREKAAPMEGLPVSGMKIECELERLDVLPLIKKAADYAKNLEQDRGIQVRWIQELDGEVFVAADARRLKTALFALFENAVKYSFDRLEVRVSGWVTNKALLLEIKNVGIGIPPERLDEMFTFRKRAEIEDQYKDRKRGGSGLGLPIAWQIISAHKGTLSIISKSTLKPPPDPDDFKSHVVVAKIQLPLAE